MAIKLLNSILLLFCTHRSRGEWGHRKMNIATLGFVMLMLSPVALAGKCEDKAKPKLFTKDTGMEAIFCEYNREHGGTLIPLINTAKWDAMNSDTLVTPTLAATYKVGNMQKGVLVLQRQMLERNGEPVSSHGQTAIISVYVFNFDGTSWVFEKGKLNVTEAGSWGEAGGGSLAKIGPDKYGLFFNSAGSGQGYDESGAFIIDLSEKNFLVAGSFTFSESNSGTCSDDPKEQEDSIVACWSYDGKPEFISMQDSPHYMLRISYGGTEINTNSRDEIVPKNRPICYTFAGNQYVVTKDRNCANYKALDVSVIFGDAAKGNRTKPISSR